MKDNEYQIKSGDLFPTKKSVDDKVFAIISSLQKEKFDSFIAWLIYSDIEKFSPKFLEDQDLKSPNPDFLKFISNDFDLKSRLKTITIQLFNKTFILKRKSLDANGSLENSLYSIENELGEEIFILKEEIFHSHKVFREIEAFKNSSKWKEDFDKLRAHIEKYKESKRLEEKKELIESKKKNFDL